MNQTNSNHDPKTKKQKKQKKTQKNHSHPINQKQNKCVEREKWRRERHTQRETQGKKKEKKRTTTLPHHAPKMGNCIFQLKQAEVGEKE